MLWIDWTVLFSFFSEIEVITNSSFKNDNSCLELCECEYRVT